MVEASLADWLRALDDDALVTLLSARRDLATPPPADTSVLASRATTRASLTRACERLDEFTLSTLEALLLAAADGHPVALPEVDALLGADVPAERTGEAVAVLRELAVAWGTDDALRVPAAAREVVPEHPGGLGRRSAELDGADVPGLLAEAGEAELRLLRALAEDGPLGRTRDAAAAPSTAEGASPVQRLLASGLLRARDAENVELPMQVGVALRGDRPMRTVRPEAPALATQSMKQSTVDKIAAGEAQEVVRHTESLLDALEGNPPGVLRSGGVGVRDTRRLARDVGVDERRLALLLELVAGAGLLAADDAGQEWVPTTHADGWLVAEPAQRWATLAGAWLELPRLPGMVGMRDEKDKALVPLADELRRPLAPAARYRVLETYTELADDTAVPDVDGVVALLAWRAPRRGGRLRDETVRWSVAEATTLGVLGMGELSTAGRALLADGVDAAAKRLAEALPDPVDHVLVQADLTVVAPGPLEPELAAEMALVADVESAGSATVYRIGEASVRRALDAGRTAADLHELFTRHSRTPVPQGLTYLIDDASRKHGRLRGGAAQSFLRCDDEALLTEVTVHEGTRNLELRRIAPTVLVSPLPLVELLNGLRGAGFAPAAEGTDGGLLDLTPPKRRIPSRAAGVRRTNTQPASPSEEQLAGLVRQLRAGDHAAAARRGNRIAPEPGRGGPAGFSATLTALQRAAASGRRMVIGVVDSRGRATQHVVLPDSAGNGVLTGTDETTGEVCRYPLHLITSVAPVED